MSMRYKGGVISATAPTTSSSVATGVWTLPQQLQAIAAGNWTGMPLVIGQAYQGGFYAGQISTAGNGIADYNLVVGPVASAQNAGLTWDTSNTSAPGTSSLINGPANSAAMNDANHPAAQFCEGLTIGGFSDWYLPSINEFEVCYFNLKPTTTANNTSFGINDNSIPKRTSNYTSGNPSQTSVANFVTSTGAEAFSADFYWSSTEFDAAYAWLENLGSGRQLNFALSKVTTFPVRAIRRVAV